MIWALRKTVEKAVNDEFTRRFLASAISDDRFQQHVNFTESEAKKLVNYALATADDESLYKKAALSVATRKLQDFFEEMVLY